MSYSLNFTLAQLNPTVGDLSSNADEILDVWKYAQDKSDLVLFPELYLCGYPPEDLSNNFAFLNDIEKVISEICEQSKNFGAAALIPTIWRDKEGIYNAALLVENGEIKHIHKKCNLPNYNVFDENRNFIQGDKIKSYEFRGVKLGIMICEDLWHPNVTNDLKNDGAEILIALNGSPYSLFQHRYRRQIAEARTSESQLNLIYLNMVGGQDELVFDGGSFVMHHQGQLTFSGTNFKEEISIINVSNDDKSPQKQLFETVEINTSEGPEFEHILYNALVTGTRDYIYKNGFSDVIIGLSGGIDSALTAAIAVDALGSDHVKCVMMPSEFTSQESLEDAKECAGILGVEYEIIPIKETLKRFEKIIPDLDGLAHENTQSRIRGTILMALSNMSGAMLLTTGNKSEMAVGYCTIYGDMNGGFNPLKDVYKTQVYQLSQWRNSVENIMPERIITKAPSAELREDQTDQDNLPPYDLLDDILYLLIECDDYSGKSGDSKFVDDIKERCAEHPDEIEKIAKLLRISEYKRYQSPPGVRVSNKAFGRDRRYPMTNVFTNRIENN